MQNDGLESERERANQQPMEMDVADSCSTSTGLVPRPSCLSSKRPSRSLSVDAAGERNVHGRPKCTAMPTVANAESAVAPSSSPARFQDDLAQLRKAKAQVNSGVCIQPSPSMTPVATREDGVVPALNHTAALEAGRVGMASKQSPRLSSDSLEDLLNDVDAAAADATAQAKIFAPSPERGPALARRSIDLEVAVLSSELQPSTPIEDMDAADAGSSSGTVSDNETPSQQLSAPMVPKLFGLPVHLGQTSLAMDGVDSGLQERREMQHNPFLEEQYVRQRQNEPLTVSISGDALEAALDRRLSSSDEFSGEPLTPEMMTSGKNMGVGPRFGPSEDVEACTSLESAQASVPALESACERESTAIGSSCAQSAESDCLSGSARCLCACTTASEASTYAPKIQSLLPRAQHISSTGPSAMMGNPTVFPVWQPLLNDHAGVSPLSPQQLRDTQRPECISMLTGSTLPIQRPASPSPKVLPAPSFRPIMNKGSTQLPWPPSHESPRQAAQLSSIIQRVQEPPAYEYPQPAVQEVTTAEKLVSPEKQPKIRASSSKQSRARPLVAEPGPVASPKAPPPRAARSSDRIQLKSPYALSASPPLCAFLGSSQTATPRRHNCHPAESCTPLSSAICRSELAANRAQQLFIGQPAASTLYRQKTSPVTDSNQLKAELPLAVPSLATKPARGSETEMMLTWCI